MHGTRKAAREKRAKIKDDYLRPALVYARRARELKPDDPDLLNTLDTINYYLH